MNQPSGHPPFGGKRTLCLIALGIATAFSAHAQVADETTTQKLEKIEVTGSSIKRIDAETALPVQVLKREDIERIGATTTEDLFQHITAMSSAGATLSAQGTGFTTGGLSAISLRGLGSDRTLVLINGRRASVYGGGSSGPAGSSVDISSIPVAAIERIEILKDGASAVYGSDAIAGVVNFILRKDYQGAEVTGTYGQPAHGQGGGDGTFSIFAGIGDLASDKYNASIALTTQQIDPIFGNGVTFASRYNPTYGNDNTSGFAFPGNVSTAGGTRNPGYPSNCGPYSFFDPNYPKRCRFDNSLSDSLEPGEKRNNALFNGHLEINSNTEGYAEASYSQVKTYTTVQPVPLTFSLPVSSPYYPTGFAATYGLTGQPLTVSLRDFPNGLRQQLDESDTSRLVLGVKGLLAGWDYDTSLLYNESVVKESLLNGFPLTSQITALLDSGVINPFGATTDPNALAQAKADELVGQNWNSRTSLTSLAGKGSRELFQLPAGPLSLAVGAELRRETFDFNPSAALLSGNVSGQGSQPAVTAGRNVESAFLELNGLVTKELEADAAIRFDDYQTIGSTVNPKASLRWQPNSSVLVRASAGSGFRAPSLTDLYAAQATSFTGNGTRDPIRCPVFNPNSPDCSFQFNTVTGGNPNLKPEKSRSYTLGILLEPVKDLSIGFDGFWIFLKDQIVDGGLSYATILANAQSATQFANYITRGAPDGNPSGVGPILAINQTNANLFKAAVSGVDVDAKYALRLSDKTRLTLYGDGSYFFRYDQQNPDGSYSGQLDQGLTVGGGVIVRWRYVAGAVLQSGGWTTSLLQNFQKHYHDVPSSITGVPRDVGSYETYDVQTSYTGIKSFKITAGIRNLLNRDPPYANYAALGNNFVGGYDLAYGDPRGIFPYLTGTYYFK